MIPVLSRCTALTALLAIGLLAQVNAQTPAPDTVVHTDAKGRHVAPRDTFYTTEYVSATTDKGVDGFPPGTEVRLVSVNQEAHTLTVTDGHANVEVSPGKLTHDLDLAEAVRAKDQRAQARVAEYQQAQESAYQKYEKEVAAYTAQDLEKREQAIQQAEVQAQPQATPSAQVVDTASYGNGYYNEGGYGYGSPYYYFTPGYLHAAERRAAGTSGRGTTSSTQVITQPGNRTSGTTTGGGQSSGGKKP
jgi:hypothetical protein